MFGFQSLCASLLFLCFLGRRLGWGQVLTLLVMIFNSCPPEPSTGAQHHLPLAAGLPRAGQFSSSWGGAQQRGWLGGVCAQGCGGGCSPVLQPALWGSSTGAAGPCHLGQECSVPVAVLTTS